MHTVAEMHARHINVERSGENTNVELAGIR
jgi:hypothetical protein